MTADEIRARVKEDKVDYLLAQYVDIHGTARCKGDPVIQWGLGPELAEEFIKVKRREWVQYHNTVSRWEIDRYLTLF